MQLMQISKFFGHSEPLKVLWILKNIFKTLHDLNDSIEKAKMVETPS